MILALGALLGLAQTIPLSTQVAEASQSVAASATTANDPVPASAAALRVMDWVATSGDNHALPYAIIDKQAARLFVFNAKGELRGQAPVLLGIAPGDDATPGVGSKNLAEIGPVEKTTPAGRFVARYGVAKGGERVLWVDYHTSVAMHPVVPGTKKERRRERLTSTTPDDNRISFGCINVPIPFYNQKVRPLFRGKKGGIVYILPDTRTLEEVFPPLYAVPHAGRGKS